MPTKPTRIHTGEARTTDQTVDEQSPLLPPLDTLEGGPSSHIKSMSPLDDRDDGEAEEDTWMGEEEETRSSWYMFLLTFGGFGLQMGWSVEMSNGSVCSQPLSVLS
jgi:solute carrier family 45 protein 1/2/4